MVAGPCRDATLPRVSQIRIYHALLDIPRIDAFSHAQTHPNQICLIYDIHTHIYIYSIHLQITSRLNLYSDVYIYIYIYIIVLELIPTNWYTIWQTFWHSIWHLDSSPGVDAGLSQALTFGQLKLGQGEWGLDVDLHNVGPPGDVNVGL